MWCTVSRQCSLLFQTVCSLMSKIIVFSALVWCNPIALPSFWQLGFKIAHFKCFLFHVPLFSVASSTALRVMESTRAVLGVTAGLHCDRIKVIECKNLNMSKNREKKSYYTPLMYFFFAERRMSKILKVPDQPETYSNHCYLPLFLPFIVWGLIFIFIFLRHTGKTVL